MGGLKEVSWDFSPRNHCKIKRDAFLNVNELSIEHLRHSAKPELKRIKLDHYMVSKIIIL